MVVQRALEVEEGVKMYRAQGRKEEQKIIFALPLEIEYQIRQYEEIEKREKEMQDA